MLTCNANQKTNEKALKLVLEEYLNLINVLFM
jgi:hypothetical protein